MMDRVESEIEAARTRGEAVSVIDANALADLIGGTIASSDSFEVKRATLLRGLSDLLGAEGWAVLSSPEGGNVSGIPANYRIEMVSRLPGRKPLPNLSTHPAGTILCSRQTLRNRETGFICLVREEGSPPFSAREECLFTIFVEEVPWLYEPALDSPMDFPGREMPPRRRLIFDLLRQGLDRKTIADRLEISVHTVSDHQKILYRDLGINSQITLMRNYRYPAPAPHENTDIIE